MTSDRTLRAKGPSASDLLLGAPPPVPWGKARSYDAQGLLRGISYPHAGHTARKPHGR